MSMSVGLAKIQNDPKATPLTRKALGALSTPHLLVDNQGISIDDEGRLFIRVKPDGGILLNDETGLHLKQTFGVDSHVNVDDDATGNRDWNMQITGTAPNYIEDDVYIGADDLNAELAEFNAAGITVDPAKVQVYAQNTQLRLFYDKTSWLSVRASRGGYTEFYSAGPDESQCGFNFVTTSGSSILGDHVTGDDAGIRINNGAEITQVITVKVLINFAGGGGAGAISWADYIITFSPYTCRDDRDTVYACIMDGVPPSAEWIAWMPYIDGLGRIHLRINWVGVTAAVNAYWKFTIIKFKDQ